MNTKNWVAISYYQKVLQLRSFSLVIRAFVEENIEGYREMIVDACSNMTMQKWDRMLSTDRIARMYSEVHGPCATLTWVSKSYTLECLATHTKI